MSLGSLSGGFTLILFWPRGLIWVILRLALFFFNLVFSFTHFSDMVMSNFFKFDKEGASARRTPLRTAATVVKLAQAIANRKLAEARLS